MGAGPAIREEMNGIAEAPGKTWFWELAAGVIDADRCIQCGVCVAVCPSDSIGVGRGNLPALVKMCTGCSLCWDFCPRGGLRYEATWPEPAGAGARETARAGGGAGETVPAGAGAGEAAPAGVPDWKITGSLRGEGLGVLRSSFSARARPQPARAQDGGVVGAVLMAALEAGDIDGALVARESPTQPWKGEAHLVRTPEEVLECGGSFYNQTMALAHLDLRGYDLPANPRLAVVGTPCEVQGLRAMQARSWPRGSSRVDAVVLTIALLCTKSFDYEGLMLRQLRERRGLDLAQVGKVDVIHGKMIVEDRQGATLVCEPVKDFHGAALKGCDECADFLGRAADLSVGSVGSPDGWSSVLVRTEAGARALDRAGARLELAELERPEALVKLDAYDRKVALASLRRDFDPDGPLFVDYEEHRSLYHPAPSPQAGSPEPGGRGAVTFLGWPGRREADEGAAAETGVGGSPAAEGPDMGKDLPVPPEPVEVARAARSLALASPARWAEEAERGEWMADALWPQWGVALAETGSSRQELASLAGAYRLELWLWVMGERTWEQAAAGLAGRVRRRSSSPVAQRT